MAGSGTANFLCRSPNSGSPSTHLTFFLFSYLYSKHSCIFGSFMTMSQHGCEVISLGDTLQLRGVRSRPNRSCFSLQSSMAWLMILSGGSALPCQLVAMAALGSPHNTCNKPTTPEKSFSRFVENPSGSGTQISCRLPRYPTYYTTLSVFLFHCPSAWPTHGVYKIHQTSKYTHLIRPSDTARQAVQQIS